MAKKKIIFKRRKDCFYAKEIKVIRKAMREMDDKGSDEYENLLRMEQELWKASKNRRHKVDWDVVMKGADILLKCVTGVAVPIALALFMYAKDQKMEARSRAVENVFNRALKF